MHTRGGGVAVQFTDIEKLKARSHGPCKVD